MDSDTQTRGEKKHLAPKLAKMELVCLRLAPGRPDRNETLSEMDARASGPGQAGVSSPASPGCERFLQRPERGGFEREGDSSLGEAGAGTRLFGQGDEGSLQIFSGP